MGFFDLNIPYPEPSMADKATVKTQRTKLVVKAMELGYTGIAYNRTIRGVMSDHHRCSIPLLTLSSLLSLAPSLSLSAKLHRDLLGIPISTPFRQYTRLTVCVDTTSQAQALNSGNPILKTYDLVAVRPLNQTAFDLACERMEVDIIWIDFSEKLPFRLKQPMVRAAAERGVHFEVTYSGLITDIQIRRQLISSAKLLVDWTRGRNIILSSAAPSVNELRGPCDVANLLSLLGLSKDRAKAAISKNCRTLVANSLRKKQFYKEAIKVEVLSPDAASHSKEALYQELLKWDPISSGEGDLLLDDLAKSFTSCKASKTGKAIDFSSVVHGIPSHGFQVNDFLTASNAVPLFQDNNVNFLPVSKKVNQSTAVVNNSTEQPNRLDFCPGPDESSLSDAPAAHQTMSPDNFIEKKVQSGTTEVFNSEVKTSTSGVKLGLKNFNDSDVNWTPLKGKAYDSQSGVCIISDAFNAVIPDESEKLPWSSDDAHNIDGELEICTTSMDTIFPASLRGKHKNEENSDVNLNAQIAEVHEAMPKEDTKIAEHMAFDINTSISENLTEDKQFSKHDNDAVELDEMTQQKPYEMGMEDDLSVATHLLPDVIMEDKELGEVSTDSDQLASVHSVPGQFGVKRRTFRGPLLFPFKLSKPIPFKRKAKKIKGRTKIK